MTLDPAEDSKTTASEYTDFLNYLKRGFTHQTPDSVVKFQQEYGDLFFQPGAPQAISDQLEVRTIFARTEQEPNRNSRIRLSDEKDSFEEAKVILEWNLTPLDFRTLHQASLLMTSYLESKYGQRVKVNTDLMKTSPEALVANKDFYVGGGNHHMGTTRMGSNPATSVVNENCVIHEISNLAVAGSSVFPTGGYANPTLTIVALAIRLAEFIKRTF